VGYNKDMTNINKKVLLIVVIVVVGFLFWQLNQPPLMPPAEDNQAPVSSSTTGVPEGQNNTKTSPKSPPIPSKTESSFIITPAKNEVWTIDKTHEIRWNKNSGSSGSIVLVDAKTNQIVGWIAPTIIPSQVTYNWDTANVQLSATNPTKKLVTPGAYYIQVLFDGSAADLRSESFTLTTNKNEVLFTQQIKITNSNFIPNYIIINRGSKVVIINENQNTNETILMGGVAMAVLLPHHSYLLDTAQFAPGEYQIRLSGSTVSRLILSVK